MSFERRESFQAANEFLMVTRPLCDVMRRIRPASSWGIQSASVQIVHLIIHSDRGLQKAPGQWRIQRAMAAAAASQRCLHRMQHVPEHRVMVGAALEVLERLTNALRAELL